MSEKQIALLVLAALPLWWCLLFHAIARFGGWAKLAARFRAQTKPQGKSFTWQSCTLGFANYSACLAIILSPSGMYLEMFLLLRCGHPALFIPWSQVTRISEKQDFWQSYCEVSIGTPHVGIIRLPLRVMKSAKTMSPTLVPDFE